MTNPSSTDVEIEDWFVRHGGDTDDLAPGVFLAIAPWIPVIGIPANDRFAQGRR